MFDAGHPGGAAFDAHAETCVRHAAVATQVEVPFEGFAWQTVRFELSFEVFERGRTFAAADDLAVTFRGEQIDAEGCFGAVFVHLEVKSLDRRREMVNEDGFAVTVREIRLVRCPEVAAPFEMRNADALVRIFGPFRRRADGGVRVPSEQCHCDVERDAEGVAFDAHGYGAAVYSADRGR